MSKYKFYITHNAVTTEVFPLYDKIKYTWKKDAVRYRKECKTDFTFINNQKNGISDFTTILDIENGALRCEIIDFEIKVSCDNGANYATDFTGSFSVNDGKFDLDKCTYKFNVLLVDKYTCLLKNINKEFNILETGPLITIKNYERPQLQFMYCLLNYADPAPDPTPSGTIFYQPPICFDDFPTPPGSAKAAWSYLYSDIVDLGVNDWHGTIIIYKRVVQTVFNVGGLPYTPAPTIFGQWWEVPGTNNGFTTQFAFEFFAPPNFVATYGTDIISVPCNSDPGAPYNLTGSKIISCVNGLDWYYVQSGTSNVEYDSFRTLYDSMLFLVQKNCPTINGLVSDFFEWNPIGDAPDYVAGFNYVTGEKNVLNKIAIAQKSDVIDPNASQAATIGNISLKRIMENFKVIFNVDWFIDDDNNFRIEHAKYFNYLLGYDTTITPNSKFNISNNKYSYKKEEMPSAEHFTFMESLYLDFVGKDITYNSSCVTNEGDNNIKQYASDRFTTDIDYIEAFPADIEKTGFVLVVYNTSGGINVVAKEIGKLSNSDQNNAHLSWANLHYNYHRYGRVLLNGNMNGVDEVFFTATRNKVQDNVKLQICCGETFEPTGKLIKTEIGQGEVETAEQENNIITLQINL